MPIEKLSEMEKTAKLARQALKGVEVPAPVISSDLQALNAAEGHPQTAFKKIRKTADQPDVEQDDEFMPGRYRDRRKRALHGAPLPAPDTEITRRQTRMHQTHYEELSEDESDEMVEPKNPTPTAKPVAKPPNVVRLDDVEFDSTDTSDDEAGRAESSASSPPVDVEQEAVKAAPKTATRAPKLTVMLKSHRPGSRDSAAEQSESSSLLATSPSTVPPKKATVSAKPPAKSVAEAQADRRAKMALIKSMEDESDAWSQESFSLDEPVSNGAAAPVAQKTSTEASSTSSAVSAHDSDLMSATPLAARLTAPKPAIVGTVKASAADWVDSDESDADLPAPNAGRGWKSVNGRNATTNSGFPAKRGRGRGRPPKHSR
jgi:hypothetical protein